MSNPYVIRISSKKGGVGKTTVAVNLSTALAVLGKRVLLVDGDPTNANISDFLGLEDPKIGFADILFNELDAESGIVNYKELGNMDLLLGSDRIGIYAPTKEQIIHFGYQAGKFNYDYIIVDTAPGFFLHDLVPIYKESLIVSIPQGPTMDSNKKLSDLYNQDILRNHVVLNRVGSSAYELNVDTIKQDYGLDIAAVLPEDPIIPQSIAKREPAYLLDRTSKFCVAIENLARAYT
ncbi:MAG: AAA family ATPase [Candidatus Micrarchaeota archaeon]|nr:AAA family ATPase [Candidatus Micrarchaeota archaeon]